MTKIRVNYYGLSEGESKRVNFRERLFKENPNMHPSFGYQTINLDERKPSFSIDLKEDALDLNPKLIQDYVNKKIFAIDVLSTKDELLTRYLLIHREKLAIYDNSFATYSLSNHMCFFMSELILAIAISLH